MKWLLKGLSGVCISVISFTLKNNHKRSSLLTITTEEFKSTKIIRLPILHQTSVQTAGMVASIDIPGVLYGTLNIIPDFLNEEVH